MIWGSDKNDGSSQEQAPPSSATSAGVRTEGPWDSTERPRPAQDYLDFGSLLVPRDGTLQIQVAANQGVNLAVLLVGDGSAVELRPVAASKSGGDWEEMLEEIARDVTNRGGEPQSGEGPWGRELRTQFPAGDDAVQPARFLGIEGPRWILRATLIGRVALPDGDDSILLDAVRGLVVVRGPEARLRWEALPLEVPEELAAAKDSPDPDHVD